MNLHQLEKAIKDSIDDFIGLKIKRKESEGSHYLEQQLSEVMPKLLDVLKKIIKIQ